MDVRSTELCISGLAAVSRLAPGCYGYLAVGRLETDEELNVRTTDDKSRAADGLS